MSVHSSAFLPLLSFQLTLIRLSAPVSVLLLLVRYTALDQLTANLGLGVRFGVVCNSVLHIYPYRKFAAGKQVLWSTHARTYMISLCKQSKVQRRHGQPKSMNVLHYGGLQALVLHNLCMRILYFCCGLKCPSY